MLNTLEKMMYNRKIKRLNEKIEEQEWLIERLNCQLSDKEDMIEYLQKGLEERNKELKKIKQNQ